MKLDDAELDELAAFLARRFDLRLEPLSAPGGAAVEQAWRAELAALQDRGMLAALLARACRRHPDDVNLRAVVELLQEPERVANGLLGLLLMGGAAVGLAAGLVMGAALLWRVGSSATPEVVAPVTWMAILDGGPVRRPVRTTIGVGGERCGGEQGRVVGYWYAGERAPEGTLVVMDRMVNVRAAYPSRANGWNTREPVRCVLRPGDRLLLSLPPVAVDGGGYWVPLVAGAVLGAEA